MNDQCVAGGGCAGVPNPECFVDAGVDDAADASAETDGAGGDAGTVDSTDDAGGTADADADALVESDSGENEVGYGDAVLTSEDVMPDASTPGEDAGPSGADEATGVGDGGIPDNLQDDAVLGDDSNERNSTGCGCALVSI